MLQWWEPGYQVYYRACHNGGSQATRYITGRVTMVGARLRGTGIYNTGCVTMVGARLRGILQGVS